MQKDRTGLPVPVTGITAGNTWAVSQDCRTTGRAYFWISSNNGVSSHCRHPVLVFDPLSWQKTFFFSLSHQNSSGLTLDLRSFFLSPYIFTPGSHLFCSFPWDSCSCSEICLAVLLLNKPSVSLLWLPSHRARPLLASLQCVNSCLCWWAQPQLSGLGCHILNGGKN